MYSVNMLKVQEK